MSYNLKLICLNISLLTLFMLSFQVSEAQKKQKDYATDRFPAIDALITGHQKALGDNLVVLISNKDTLLYKRTMGDFDDHTVAPIESASKWLTTALILQLVDEGKLSLDDKVSQYIPIYSLYAKNYITLRNCLSHYTGIQSESKVLGLVSRKKYESLEQQVSEFAKQEIQANPGTEFRYNDIGLNIAARIAEIVTRKKFEMLIRQKLFLPLAMRQTSFATPDGSAPNPSGGATSTAADYMHFLEMLLNNGVYKGQRVLSEAAMTNLRTITTKHGQIKASPKIAEDYSYAMGSWVVEENRQHQAVALSSLGLFGTWPIVDFCRGYAALIFVKNPVSEQKADTDKVFIKTTNEAFQGRQCE